MEHLHIRTACPADLAACAAICLGVYQAGLFRPAQAPA